MTFAEQIITFTRSLRPDWPIPSGVEMLYPYEQAETMAALEAFYHKYYQDQQRRIFIFGINPGRFGAGITGVPFTDPIRLEEACGITNAFHKRAELSSIFVYAFIEAFGGIEQFYRHFCITSICPLGFTKNGKNYNYYDDRGLEKAVTPYIIDHMHTLLGFYTADAVALCMGMGKNYEYFQKLNDTHGFFGQILPLPHPRWVMQYRLKRMEEFVQGYVEQLSAALQLAGLS